MIRTANRKIDASPALEHLGIDVTLGDTGKIVGMTIEEGLDLISLLTEALVECMDGNEVVEYEDVE